MTSASRVRVLGVAMLALLAHGCLIRTYPLPPPTADRTRADTCGPPLCPNGGVVLTIVGRASPGSLIVAENVTRHHADGRRYSASAWASDMVIAPDGSVGDASVGSDAAVAAQAAYTLVLSPETDPDGTVTVSQLGDRVTVVQFVRNDQGLWQQSDSAEVIAGP